MRATLLVATSLVVAGCDGGGGAPPVAPAAEGTVVLYCSLDEPFSRFIQEDFHARTGITVRFLTDEETDKSVGLRGKLMSERANPQCDVFWNNEPGNTEVLRQAGLLQPYKSPAAAGIPDRFMDPDGYWTGFAARARVLIVNTQLVPPSDEPRSFDDVVRFGPRGAIALPVAGTTATHAAALYAAWGDERGRAYFQRIKDAGVVIATGNAHVMKLVADGEVAMGWTDSDDVHVAVQQGKPVKVIYPDQGEGQAGTLVLPNTVMMIAGCPHPEAGRRLIDYLLSPAIEERLAAGASAQMPLHPGVKVPEATPAGFVFDHARLRSLPYDARAIGAKLPAVIEEMKRIFQR
jgi:iron(III) transport system substrate-binding protein